MRALFDVGWIVGLCAVLASAIEGDAGTPGPRDASMVGASRAQPASVAHAGGSGLVATASRPPGTYLALALARVCWVEAGFSRPDCAAIYGVAKARGESAGRHWGRVLTDYSALYKGSRRARFALGLGWGPSTKTGEAWNAGWERLREHARAIVSGDVQSPCPGAVHWGSRTHRADVRRAKRAVREGRWKAVECRPTTANAFYALARK